MTRAELEHIIRAAAAISGDDAAIKHQLVDREVLVQRAGDLPIDPPARQRVLDRIAYDFSRDRVDELQRRRRSV